jgi:hypothetical protein
MKAIILAIAAAVTLAGCATRVYESHTETETVPATIVAPAPDVILY